MTKKIFENSDQNNTTTNKDISRALAGAECTDNPTHKLGGWNADLMNNKKESTKKD